MIFAGLAVGKHLFSSQTLGRNHRRAVNVMPARHIYCFFREELHLNHSKHTENRISGYLYITEGYNHPYKLFFLLEKKLDIYILTYIFLFCEVSFHSVNTVIQ